LQAYTPNWGLTRISERANDLSTMSYTFPENAGRDVDVYLLDSGIDTSHPEFEGRAYNLDNFVHGEPNVDTMGHGTHVAGVIGSVSYGVAKKCRIFSLKVLNNKGDGKLSAILGALYQVAYRPVQSQLRVVNMSFHTELNDAVDRAVESAVKNGVVVVAAAANLEGADACSVSPAASPWALTVSAIDQRDEIPPYSATGRCIKIYAPGDNIPSCWPNGGVMILSGTSMAAPFVSGIASLFIGAGVFATARDVLEHILTSSTGSILASKAGDIEGRIAYNNIE